MSADARRETDVQSGAPALRELVAYRMDIQKVRLGAEQRGMPADMTKPLDLLEDRLDRQIKKVMMAHPIWPWLSQYPGLGGFQVARLVAIIGDPHRFPGRVCEAGHHHPAAVSRAESEKVPGCGLELADGTVCAAPIGATRRGTGTRSIWHYLGLHVVNGRSPRKRKGERHDWNDEGRTAVLMPGGIADAIVRSRVPHYRDVWADTKLRLIATRAVDPLEIDIQGGAQEGAKADGPFEVEGTSGLRPFQIDAIARKVAAKAFVGDLLRELKRALPVDDVVATEATRGRESAA